MKAPVIRKCNVEDIPALYEIELESFKPEDVYSHELLRFLCTFCNDHSHVYMDGGRIVGYIITCIEGNAAHVISIAVSSKYRRRGIGRFLLCTALQLLAKGAVKKVFLEVRASNKPAISLYAKAGFEKEEHLPNYYSDGEDGYRLALTDREKAAQFCSRREGIAR